MDLNPHLPTRGNDRIVISDLLVTSRTGCIPPLYQLFSRVAPKSPIWIFAKTNIYIQYIIGFIFHTLVVPNYWRTNMVFLQKIILSLNFFTVILKYIYFPEFFLLHFSANLKSLVRPTCVEYKLMLLIQKNVLNAATAKLDYSRDQHRCTLSTIFRDERYRTEPDIGFFFYWTEGGGIRHNDGYGI